MKKIFTLLFMCVLAISAQAKITIYVQSETAPFLWTWGAVGGTFDNVGDWPGTLQFTETYTHPDTGDSFWMYSFPEEITQISFLFNNGDPADTKQTSDVKDVSSDRYFILSWDDGEGSVSLQDVTEDYTEIPDAQVSTLGVSGSHVGWDDPTVFAEIIEAGKKFKYTLVPTEGDASVQFKFRPNGASWMGYWDVYYNADGDAVEGKTSNSEAPKWLEYTNDGNFKIDYNKFKADAFIFTMTWNGGKSATSNWTIVAEATNLEELNPEPVTIDNWTIAGEEALCGVNWDPTYTNNDMVKGDDGIFRLTRTDVALEALTYGFKVVADHSWDNENYGAAEGGNQTITIDVAGNYDVTFVFNPESKELYATAQVHGAASVNAVKTSLVQKSVIYNLQGQRVKDGYRGIAIKNGHKVVIK